MKGPDTVVPVRHKAEREAVLAFSEASLSLTDILDAIVAIEQFTQDMDLDSFRRDPADLARVGTFARFRSALGQEGH
jgi:hypothetical protein